MKHTSPNAFTVFDGTVEPPVKLSLVSDEFVVGWYRNPPPWEHDVIVFTSKAFYLVDDERVDRIAWTDVVDYERPKSKIDVTGVRVTTKDGFRFVRVAGCFGDCGQYKDAFSFINVIGMVAHVNRVNGMKGGSTSPYGNGKRVGRSRREYNDADAKEWLTPSVLMALLVQALMAGNMKYPSPDASTVFDGTVEPPVKLSLAPDESIFGWYRNPPPWEHSVIVFTSQAFYLVDDERVDRIALSDVMDCEMPTSEEGVTGFRVITKDGFRFVRMAGRTGPHGDHTDAFRFIDYVNILARMNRENATKGG